MRNLVTTKGAFRSPDSKTIAEHLARAAEEGFWLDIEKPDDDDIAILRDCFKFHPLALEDVTHKNQRPKMDGYPDYEFIVLFSARLSQGELTADEYHLFIAEHYLVTVHDHPAEALHRLRDKIAETPDLTRGRPDFLTYVVMDEMVDETFPALEELDLLIDDLQDSIVEHAQPEQLRQIYSIKHSVTQLRQLLGAERDLFQRLITESLEDQELAIYYRDVYDHIIRQYETIDSLRDLLTGAMDVYLSTVSNRLNVTMKQLTVVASIFLPISFLTGFYGMNFTFLTTVLEVPYWAFWIGLATMLGAIGLQIYVFKRRGWI